jgi:hypothetical protein
MAYDLSSMTLAKATERATNQTATILERIVKLVRFELFLLIRELEKRKKERKKIKVV